ncbi:MAG TPA: XdhC/CoxI family protein [Acidimicrobiales bacterium]|nr:XdhC/CoxI family protein [Acidimicrobiales bacterium]
MKGVFQEVQEWLARGEPVALARVVEVVGSGVRPAGAAIAVTGSEVIGSASGGCVEGALVEEARAALADEGKARLRTFGCSDDEAFDVGLTCGGLVRVLIERFDTPSTDEMPWLDRLLAMINEGKGVALVEVIDGPPQLLGWKGIVPADALIGLGSHATVDFAGADRQFPTQVARDAVADLAAERSAAHTYHLRGERGEVEVTVFVDTFPAPPEMVIVGAASFTAALTGQAKLLGYHVVVCDARPVFATPGRFPLADEVVAEWPDRYLQRTGARLGPRDALCVLTHDPKFDVTAILAALRTEVGYIGVMGSRRTQEDRRKRLLEAGATQAELARLRGPVGLDLGASSSEETAVSIVGEIIALRHGRGGGSLASSQAPIHPVVEALGGAGPLAASSADVPSVHSHDRS